MDKEIILIDIETWVKTARKDIVEEISATLLPLLNTDASKEDVDLFVDCMLDVGDMLYKDYVKTEIISQNNFKYLMGYSPTEVSALNIRASAPSKTAFATSFVSARVGR